MGAQPAKYYTKNETTLTQQKIHTDHTPFFLFALNSFISFVQESKCTDHHTKQHTEKRMNEEEKKKKKKNTRTEEKKC